MRVEAAGHIKRDVAPTQLAPREGTRVRRMFDLLKANKGVPISMPLTMFDGGTRGHNRSRVIMDLQDYYGLDIRNLGRGKWVLAGEWFGRTYVDYIADHLARLEREARQ